MASTRFARDNSGQDLLLLAARLLLAAIFIHSGFGKLLDRGAFTTSLAGRGVPMAGVVAVIGAAVEFGGGVAVAAGLWTRPAAVLMAIFTVVATGLAHRFWEAPEAARQMQEIHFMKNVAIIGGYLALAACGGGGFALDRLRSRR